MDALKKLTLLFLEDNYEFAKNTKEFLEGYFKAVIHEESLISALDYFKERKVDVILTDIKLSDGNGLDFITEVRALNPDVPIIVLSAHKDEEFLFKAIPLGITAYELKPITYDTFIALLKKINLLFEPKGIISLSEVVFYNENTQEIINESMTIALTQTEVKFIELLLKHKILTYEIIQRDIFEEKLMSSASLKNLLLRLRKKIGSDVITTLNGIGYRLSTRT